jgi:propionyl-CoA synthetase
MLRALSLGRAKEIVGILSRSRAPFKAVLSQRKSQQTWLLALRSLHSSSSLPMRAFAYDEAFKGSIEDPDTFWGEVAEGIDWYKPYTRVLDHANPPFTKWLVQHVKLLSGISTVNSFPLECVFI